MSFSSDCKNSLCPLPVTRSCCVISEAAALFETLGTLSFLGRGAVNVSFIGLHLGVCRRIYSLLNNHLGIKPQLHYVNDTYFGGRRKCVLTLGPIQSPRFLQLLGMAKVTQTTTGATQLTLLSPSPRLSLNRICCMRSYLRGIFLGGGTVNHPAKGYRLELPTPNDLCHERVAKSLQRLNLPIHPSTRGEHSYFCVTDAEGVMGLLSTIGCTSEVLTMQNLRFSRELVGTANRATNCDNANARRMAAASENVIRQITKLMKQGGMDSLPPKLREAADIRYANPGVGIGELCRLCDPPVSKSTMIRRLNQIEKYMDPK